MMKKLIFVILTLFSIQIIFSAPAPINSCQALSTGQYILTQNITGIAGTCFTFTNSNVEIDCDGYTISGTNTGSGIHSNGYSNENISNCVIENFDYGIYDQSGSGGKYTNIITNNNDLTGIYIYLSNSNTITNLTANNNGNEGIRLNSNTDSNTITNLTANNNQYGIFLYDTPSAPNNNVFTTFNLNNTVYDIWVDSNTNSNTFQNGISNTYIYDPKSNTYTNISQPTYLPPVNKTIYLIDNSKTIYLTGDYSSTGTPIQIKNNNIKFDCQGYKITGANTGSGIYSLNRNSETISNCVLENFDYGIYLQGGSSGTFTNITTNNNDLTGFYIYVTSSNTFTNLISNNNGNEGIRLQSNTDANTITNLTSTNNTYGIYLYDTPSAPNNNIISEFFLNSTSNYDIWIDTGTASNTFSNGITNKYIYDTNSNTYTNVEQPEYIEPVNITMSLIDNTKTLYLEADYSSTGTPFLIKNNNIKFDCQGNKMTGTNTGSGIDSRSKNGEVVSNCVIENFDYGIYLFSGSSGTYTNITANNNDLTGIYIYTKSSSEFTNIITNNNGNEGIRFESNTDAHTITNLTSINNNYGIYMWDTPSAPNNNVISDFTITPNNLKEIYIDSGTTSNTFYDGHMSNNSAITNSQASNLFYKTVGSNYIGNWWTDSNACTDKNQNTSFVDSGYLWTVCTSADYIIGATRDKGVILSKTAVPTPTTTYIAPTPNNLETVYNTTITINVSVDLSPSSCILNFNGTQYPMTNTTGYCNITLNNLAKGTYTYSITADYLGSNKTSTSRQVIIDTPQPTYSTPTPNTNVKTAQTTHTINMSYNSNTITNCQLNLDNGTTIPMPDQTTYCQTDLTITDRTKKIITYNISYTLDAQTEFLENRNLIYYSTQTETNILFPAQGIVSTIISISIIFFTLII